MSWSFAQFLYVTCASILASLWSLGQEYLAERLLGKLQLGYMRFQPKLGFCWGYVKNAVVLCWGYIRRALFTNERGGPSKQTQPPESASPTGVQLPTTGEEAIKRLLSFKGRDAYSILGVTRKATDKEINKYYKKQAILVHPDKNKQAGAEEAFKILGHSFSLIGDPAKRQQYDNETMNQDEFQSGWEDIRGKFEELQEKLQQARNLIPCTKCEATHMRILVDRQLYEARYCSHCDRKHAVKEGEVWAETTCLGFRWHYFACMDGKVFNITPWAQCQHEVFSQVRPNTHIITLKIQSQKQRPHTRSGTPGDLGDYMDLLDKVIHDMQQGREPNETDLPPGFPGYGRGAGASAPPPAAHKRPRKKKR